MAITRAQAIVIGSTVSTPTISGTFGSNTTTGNTIVVIAQGYGGATLRTVSSISISSGSAAFSKIVAQVALANTYGCNEGWAAAGITGGTTPTVTVTFSGAITDGVVFLYELAGMPGTIVTDGTASGKVGTSSTALSANAITTTGNNHIIFAAFAVFQAVSVTEAGWVGTIDTLTGAGSQYIIETAPQTSLVATSTEAPAGLYSAIVFGLNAVVSNILPTAKGGSVGSGSITVRLRSKTIGGCAGTGAVSFRLRSPAIGGLIGVGAVNFKLRVPITGSVTGSSLVTVRIRPSVTGSAAITALLTARETFRPTGLGVFSGLASVPNRLVYRPLSIGFTTTVSVLTARQILRVPTIARSISSAVLVAEETIHSIPIGFVSTSAFLTVRVRPVITVLGSVSAVVTTRVRNLVSAASSATAIAQVRDRSLALASGLASASVTSHLVCRPAGLASGTGTAVLAARQRVRSSPIGSAVGSASVTVRIRFKIATAGSALSVVTSRIRSLLSGSCTGASVLNPGLVCHPKAIASALAIGAAAPPATALVRPLALAASQGAVQLQIKIRSLAIGSALSSSLITVRLTPIRPTAIATTVSTGSGTPRLAYRAVYSGNALGSSSFLGRTVYRQPSNGITTATGSVTARFSCRPKSIGLAVGAAVIIEETGGTSRPHVTASSQSASSVAPRVREKTTGNAKGVGSVSVRPVSGPTAFASCTTNSVLVLRIGGNYVANTLGASNSSASVVFRLRVKSAATANGSSAITNRYVVRSRPAATAIGSALTGESVKVGSLRPLIAAACSVSSVIINRGVCRTHPVSLCFSSGTLNNIYVYRAGTIASTLGSFLLFKEEITRPQPISIMVCSSVVTDRTVRRTTGIGLLIGFGSTGESDTRIGSLRPMVSGSCVSVSSVSGRRVIRNSSSGATVCSGSVIERNTLRPSPFGLLQGSGFTIKGEVGGVLRVSAVSSCIITASVVIRKGCFPSAISRAVSSSQLNEQYRYQASVAGLSGSNGEVDARPNREITLTSGAITQSMVSTPRPIVRPMSVGSVSSGASILNGKIQTITGGGNVGVTRIVRLGKRPTRVTLVKGVFTPVTDDD